MRARECPCTLAEKTQNFPQLAAAVPGAVTRITGLLASEPDRSYTVDFYAGLTAGAGGRGEASGYLGSIDITTDGTGEAFIDASLPVLSSSGEWVTATATDAAGNTSEFSLAIPVNEFPWQNPVNTFDVNADGGVAPLDVLIVINFINAHPGQPLLPPRYDAVLPFYDVSGDDSCDAVDVLIVINYINSNVLRSPAGETADATIALAPSIAFDLTDVLGAQTPSYGVPFGSGSREGTEFRTEASDRAERLPAERQMRGDGHEAVDRLFVEVGMERKRNGERFTASPNAAEPWERTGGAHVRWGQASPLGLALETVLDDLVANLQVV